MDICILLHRNGRSGTGECDLLFQILSAAGCQCCKPEIHRLLQSECLEILKVNGRHATLCNFQSTYNIPVRVGQHAIIKLLCQRQARVPNDRIAKRIAIFSKRVRIE